MKKLKKFFFCTRLKVLKNFPRTQKILVEKNFPKKKYNEKFTLIAGCPRAGTNLLTYILSTHPDIFVGKTEIDFSSFRFKKELKKVFGKKLKKNFEKTIKDLANQKKILLRRPTAIDYYETLLKKFPNLEIILIFRDGRDNALSLKNAKHFKWPFDFAVKKWKEWVKIKERAPQRVHILKYETLIQNPEKEINSIFKFMGLKELKEKEIIEFYKNKTENYHSEIKGKPITNEKIFRWKKEMTDQEKEIFKKLAGKELIKIGYEKDNDW